METVIEILGSKSEQIDFIEKFNKLRQPDEDSTSSIPAGNALALQRISKIESDTVVARAIKRMIEEF